MNEANMQLTMEKTDIFYRVVKRGIDIVTSFIALVLLSPIFLITFILIKLDSKGKAIFKQERIGKNGQPIYIYKFRSMIPDADLVLEKILKEDKAARAEYKKNKKLANDPRITKIGKFIRATSIDELPQLVNIFLGDMSLVGPRPYLYREKEDMGEYYDTVIKMKPGLTGLWQVSGRSETTFAERLEQDEQYLKTRSLKTDIKILFKTFSVVLKRKGAK